MPDYDNMSLNEIFMLDSTERIGALNKIVLKLEKDSTNAELYDDAMREAHSLKAAARIVNNFETQNLSHLVEEVLLVLQKGVRKLNASYIDLFLETLDAAGKMTESFVEGTTHDVNVADLMKRLEEAKEGKVAPHKHNAPSSVEIHEEITSVPSEPPPAKDVSTVADKYDEIAPEHKAPDATIRMGVERLNKLMNLSGEIYTNTLQLGRQKHHAKAIYVQLAELATHLDVLKSLVREEKIHSRRLEEWLYKNETDLYEIQEAFGGYSGAMDRVNLNFEYLGTELQDDMMKTRMLPVSLIFDTQVRFVRDQARESGKKIRLDLQGGETQMDRNILELLKDPLTHLVRNACDHGIEASEDRKKAGKDDEAKLTLKAYFKADRVEIQIEDDGNGVDLEQIKEKAISKGMLSQEKLNELHEDEILDLVFLPGFSTAKKVTAISGRGVGLDVVRSTLSKIGGRINLKTQKNKFTRFTLSLPLTLAVTKALLAQAGSETFCFPLTRVEEVAQIDERDIQKIEGKESITLRDEIIAFVSLTDLWGYSPQSAPRSTLSAIIIGEGRQRIALSVDKLMGEKAVVGKALDTRLGTVQDISGAAILEDGQTAFIVDVDSLLRSGADFTGTSLFTRAEEIQTQRRQKILIVEDSLTVRELEKKVLENNGYEVMTAVDGLDGLNKAREFKADLIVTDIEMPKMDGFELISLLKKEKQLSRTPTIIVSFRESEDDKRRGMEVGADTYLTKSQYDNKTLLEAIGRLIG